MYGRMLNGARPSYYIQILFISKYNRGIRGSLSAESILGTYESLIFSSAFDLAIYSVFIEQFQCPISNIFVYNSCTLFSLARPSIFFDLLSLPRSSRTHLSTYSSCFIAVFIGTPFFFALPIPLDYILYTCAQDSDC